ncbi:MAG: hypothetical protein FWG68_04990 [Defluviitaleaceae bacterium]|nr:hypothetical protein [Defluviitaleaceae bacterium]
MRDLLLTIYCPSTAKMYDFWVPTNMPVSQAIDLICEDIKSVENDNDIFHSIDDLVLCSYQNRQVLQHNLSFGQSGVKSGDKLALV